MAFYWGSIIHIAPATPFLVPRLMEGRQKYVPGGIISILKSSLTDLCCVKSVRAEFRFGAKNFIGLHN